MFLSKSYLVFSIFVNIFKGNLTFVNRHAILVKIIGHINFLKPKYIFLQRQRKISVPKLLIFRAKVRVRALSFQDESYGVRAKTLTFLDLGLGQARGQVP